MDIQKDLSSNPRSVDEGENEQGLPTSLCVRSGAASKGPAKRGTGMTLAAYRARRVTSGKGVGCGSSPSGLSSTISGLVPSPMPTSVPTVSLKTISKDDRVMPARRSGGLHGTTHLDPRGSSWSTGSSTNPNENVFSNPVFQISSRSAGCPPSLSHLIERLLTVFAPYPIPTLMTTSDSAVPRERDGTDRDQSIIESSSRIVSHRENWREAFLASRTVSNQITYVVLLVCLGPEYYSTRARSRSLIESWMDMTCLNPRAQALFLWNALRSGYSFIFRRGGKERCFFNSDLEKKHCSMKSATESIAISHKSQKEENGRLVIHYNGHGQPPATNRGEIWMANDEHSCYEPFDIQTVAMNLDGPVIIVLDVDSAGAVLNSWNKASLTKSKPNICFLCACSEGESLPKQPGLPGDLLTSSLTTPLRMAITWHLYRSSQGFLRPNVHREWVERQLASPSCPFFQCLDLILNAVLDAVAWCTLPDASVYHALFRVDNTTRHLFRYFVLANYVGHCAGCCPVSHPPLRPEASQHYMWDCWEYTLDKALSLADPGISPSSSVKKERTDEITETFFDEQITTFKLWIQRGESYDGASGVSGTLWEGKLAEEEDGCFMEEAADVLPCILLILGLHKYTLRMIALLIRYMDVNRAAAKSAIYCGVLAYLSRLCQNFGPLLLLVMVLWMQSFRADVLMASEVLQETVNMAWMVHTLRLREGTTELLVMDPDNLEMNDWSIESIKKLIVRESLLPTVNQGAKGTGSNASNITSSNTKDKAQPVQPNAAKTTRKEVENGTSSSAALMPNQPTTPLRQKPLPPSTSSPRSITHMNTAEEEPLQPIRKPAILSVQSSTSDGSGRKEVLNKNEHFILLCGLSLQHCQAMVCYSLCHFMSLGVEQCMRCWNSNLFGLAYPLISMGYEGGGGGGGSVLDTTVPLPVPGARGLGPCNTLGGSNPTSLASQTGSLERCSWGCLVLASLFRGLRYAQVFASKFFSGRVRQFELLRHASNTVRSSYITLLGTVVGVPLSGSTEQEQARQLQMEKKLLVQIRKGIMYDPSAMVRREVIYFASQFLYAYYLMIKDEEENFSNIEPFVLGPLERQGYWDSGDRWRGDASGMMPQRGDHSDEWKPPVVKAEMQEEKKENDEEAEKRESEDNEEDRKGSANAKNTWPPRRSWDQWHLEEPEVRVQSSLHSSKPTDNAQFADLNLPVVDPIAEDDPPPSSRLTLASVKNPALQEIIIGLVEDSGLILRCLYRYGDEVPVRSALQELAMGKRPTSQRLQEESRRTMSSVGLRDVMDSSSLSYSSPSPTGDGMTPSGKEPSSFTPYHSGWTTGTSATSLTRCLPKTEVALAVPSCTTATAYPNGGTLYREHRIHAAASILSAVPLPTESSFATSFFGKEEGTDPHRNGPHAFPPSPAYRPHPTEAERIRMRWNEDAMRDIVGDMVDRATLEPDHLHAFPMAFSSPASRHQLLPSIIAKKDPICCTAFRVLEPQLIVATQSQKLYTINYERYYYQEIIEEYSLLESSGFGGTPSLSSVSSSPHGGLRSPIRSLMVINDLSVDSAFLAVTERGNFVVLKESTLHPPLRGREGRGTHVFSRATPSTSCPCRHASASLSPQERERNMHPSMLQRSWDERKEEEREMDKESGETTRRYLQVVGTFSAVESPMTDGMRSTSSPSGPSPAAVAPFDDQDVSVRCSYVSHAAVLFYGGCIGPKGEVGIKALSLADERVVDDLHVISDSPLTALSADLDRRSVYAGFQDGYIRYYDDRQRTGMKMTEVTKEMCGGGEVGRSVGPGSHRSRSRVSPAVIDLAPISSITASFVGGSVVGGSGHTVVAATALGVYIYDTRKWREPVSFLSHVALYETELGLSFSVSSTETGDASGRRVCHASSAPLLTRCSISSYAGILGVCFSDQRYGAFTTRGHLLSQGLLFPTWLDGGGTCLPEMKENVGQKVPTRGTADRNVVKGHRMTCITHPVRPFMSMDGDVLFLE